MEGKKERRMRGEVEMWARSKGDGVEESEGKEDDGKGRSDGEKRMDVRD